MLHKINHAIKLDSVVLIDEEGKNLGAIKFQDAIKLAQDKELDLVLVNEQNKICRLMNYEKHLYEQKKKEKANSKPKHSSQIKEIKFGPNIGEHDVEIKVKKVVELLTDGYQTKISCVLKGRQMRFKDKGVQLIHKVYERATGTTAEAGVVKVTDNTIFALLSPNNRK